MLQYDVAIVGGGPAGSTCGAFLNKYRPGIKVGIFERERFPREHVGESQLPLVGVILNELGVWDRVEAARFPIKIGATYRWGTSQDLWDFHFVPNGVFGDEERPAPYAGARTRTAFQVDRAIYDKILLDFAAETGCEVHEECTVRTVEHTSDRIDGLVLDNGERITARHYVDATGHVGLLRRAMGVSVEEPSILRNIAIWDYWQNAEWAVSIGVGGTRVQVMSLEFGWLWFIPLGPDRTSIGLVCPADYYKKSGKKPEQLYLEAIAAEPRISALVAKAQREYKLGTTKDWSFLAERMSGENWFLVGESLGFADPILAAGLTMAHASAREAAFTMLEMDRGKGKKWLREEYEHRNRRRLMQHIRFADYWYSANSHFTDLLEFTREIAKDAGLRMSAQEAWQWLGTGGFIEEDMQSGGVGTVSLIGLHQVSRRLTEHTPGSPLDGCNAFILNLKGAKKVNSARYEAGRVLESPCYSRNGKLLPLTGFFGIVIKALERGARIEQILANVLQLGKGLAADATLQNRTMETVEALMWDGWVEGKRYSSIEPLKFEVPAESSFIASNRDNDLPQEQVASALRQQETQAM